MKAKKKFGQNFLVDRYYISKIINEINPKEESNILEIGPGKGAITEPILKKINHISVVEIDPDMIKILKHKIFLQIYIKKLIVKNQQMKLHKTNNKQAHHLVFLKIIKFQLELDLKLWELLMQMQTYYVSLKLQKKMMQNK